MNPLFSNSRVLGILIGESELVCGRFVSGVCIKRKLSLFMTSGVVQIDRDREDAGGGLVPCRDARRPACRRNRWQALHCFNSGADLQQRRTRGLSVGRPGKHGKHGRPYVNTDTE